MRIGPPLFFLENTLPNVLDNFLDREYQNMKNMFLIIDGDVTIKEESGANNVVILSKGKITIENNVNFSGSIQAKNQPQRFRHACKPALQGRMR